MPHLDLQLDFRSDVPIYTQIVEYIQRQVLAGVLKPGDQLPTVRQMAIDLRINFNTVARAYRILDDMRLISTQQGRGTYIWESDDVGKPPPQGDDREADREAWADRLVRNFLEGATGAGFSPEEIRAAFDRELKNRSKGGN